MENIGFLPKEKARNVAVGPIARASGVDFDLRRDAPYAAYDKIGVDVKLRTEGDVMSRMSLRLEELLESIDITKRALDQLPHYEDTSIVAEIRGGHATSRVEAPRGENRYSIEIDEKGILQKLGIRTPTYSNLHVLRDILLEQNTEDLEIILLSIDPCISCACRRIYI
jgi:Ni,Fe-hydrogenase III large subunit